MRTGDIFMGAFNAERVMHNHFGYRTPIANLYNAGSAGHPGGAISGGSGYITRRHHRARPRVEVVVEALGRARSP
jgi:phytoene dehydrogenase-like protein